MASKYVVVEVKEEGTPKEIPEAVRDQLSPYLRKAADLLLEGPTRILAFRQKWLLPYSPTQLFLHSKTYELMLECDGLPHLFSEHDADKCCADPDFWRSWLLANGIPVTFREDTDYLDWLQFRRGPLPDSQAVRMARRLRENDTVGIQGGPVEEMTRARFLGHCLVFRRLGYHENDTIRVFWPALQHGRCQLSTDMVLFPEEREPFISYSPTEETAPPPK